MVSRLLRHEKKEDSIVIKFRAQSSELNQKEGKKKNLQLKFQKKKLYLIIPYILEENPTSPSGKKSLGVSL